MDYVMNLDFEEGMDLIHQAQEKELERFAWDLYVSEYPYMTENTFRTFSEFKKAFSAEVPCIRLETIKKDRQTDKELICELGQINAAAKEMSE